MAGKIAKGIKGINKIKADNRAGWHITIGETYSHFDQATFSEILMRTDATLVWAGGNVLQFV
jgi:hypothetical protein